MHLAVLPPTNLTVPVSNITHTVAPAVSEGSQSKQFAGSMLIRAMFTKRMVKISVRARAYPLPTQPIIDRDTEATDVGDSEAAGTLQ